MSASNERPRRLRWLPGLVAAGLLLLIWLASGVRTLDPRDEFGVLDGVLGTRRVEGSWALAPPGLVRLTRYPLRGVELPLPGAEQARLQAADGSLFGFVGWAQVRVRPESWESLHARARGAGLRGVLLDAVQQAGAEIQLAGRGVMTAARARGFEQRLAAELDRGGVELRGLQLDSLDFLAVRGDDVAPDTAPTRLLVVGLDGADWAILDPLMQQGRLPTLKRLVDSGVRAKLLSISPMLSPVIWTSAATGVEPTRHGILDFMVADPDGESRQPVTSAQRQVPTVWEVLSRRGVNVGVVGWWASWPADAVRGYLVSDRIAYQLFGFRSDVADAEGKTWPPELYDEIRPRIVAPESVGWDEVVPYLAGPRKTEESFDEDERELIDGLRTLLASGRSYLDIASSLRQRFAPQLEVVYFEGTDTVGHLFMPYRRPPLPGVDPRRIESFSEVVDRYYETADRYLGQLLADRDESWTVMILSDHGFASDATRPRSTDSRIGHGAAADWHRRFGVLILAGEHIDPAARIEEASIYDIAPTVLALYGQPVPESWPGRVLGEALDREFLERHPVRFRPDDPERDLRTLADGGVVDEDAAALIEKLQALGYISGGSDTTSDSISARNNAGVAFLAEGRYADAEREFRAGLDIEPQAAMLQFNLGVALRFQGKTEDAMQLFEATLGHPQTLRMAAHMLAQIRIGRGDHEAARTVLEQALAAEPDASELRNLLGLVLERSGDRAGAIREYEAAAALDPDSAQPRNNLGNLARNAGDLSSAEQWYQRAIEADPYFMAAYNNLALIYQDLGQMDKALDLYNRALAKAPEHAELLNNVGSWYFATGDRVQAGRLWSRAAAADPGFASPLNNLAGLAITDGRMDDAERLLRQALALDPDYGDARINLALVLGARGDAAGVREQLGRATIDPRAQANAFAQLGFFELSQGFVERAVEALEQATTLAPRHFRAWNALGEAYRLVGRQNDAEQAWRKSIEIKPDQPQVSEALRRLAEAG